MKRLLCLLLACTPLPTLEAPSAQSACESAVQRWHRATGLVPATPKLEPVQGSFLCGGHIVSGCFNHRTRTLRYNTELSPRRLQRMIIHEHGHSLGVRAHSRRGVMSENVADACITIQDLETVCAEVICLWRRPEC